MNKKQIAKKYIRNNVDFVGLKRDIANSDMKHHGAKLLACNGLVFKYFYDIELKAIKIANYKYPRSDRTCETLFNIKVELLEEMKNLIQL